MFLLDCDAIEIIICFFSNIFTYLVMKSRCLIWVPNPQYKSKMVLWTSLFNLSIISFYNYLYKVVPVFFDFKMLPFRLQYSTPAFNSCLLLTSFYSFQIVLRFLFGDFSMPVLRVLFFTMTAFSTYWHQTKNYNSCV